MIEKIQQNCGCLNKMMHCDYDYLFKIILLGNSGVGKSNIFSRFTRNEFEWETRSTIGVDFGTSMLSINDRVIKTVCWDTSGHEKFRAVTASYYRGAIGALLVYSITDRESFVNAKQWVQELRKHNGGNVHIMLVGNKCDLAHLRMVDIEEGEKLAKKEGLLFLEVSALEDIKIKEAFTLLCEEILKSQPSPWTTSAAISVAKPTIPVTKPTDTCYC